MSNPAADLANLFAAWDAHTQKTVYAARHPSGSSRIDLSLWRQIGESFRLVQEIERQLDAREQAGKEVSHYRELLPGLYERVVLPEVGWNGSTSAAAAVLSAEQRRGLRMMADVLDNTEGATGAHLSTVQLKLLQARDLLNSMRRTDVASLHLLWQIEQALKLIADIGRHDPAYVAEVVDEVVRQGAALDADLEQDETVTPEERSTFRMVMRDIAVGMTSSALFQGAMVAAPEALKALGG